MSTSDTPSKRASSRPVRASRGRGALSNTAGRFESMHSEAFDDGWDTLDEDNRPATQLQRDTSKSVLVFNQSPDVPFDRSVNPYRGCEHGCVYCFARPTHAYLGLSPGIDFETRIFTKPDAAKLLEEALRKPGYSCEPIALGINTDGYQPSERKLRITRSILEVLRDFRHPVSIVTKSALVERDLDLLAEMAADNLVSVCVSLTTLDAELARIMEPRAAAPHRRLQTIEALTRSGVPVTALLAPVIPVLTDRELDDLVARVTAAGAISAGYILLRLPLEIADLFEEWLREHYPLKADHVMKRVKDTRGGNVYDSRFGHRMRGTGEYAAIIGQRFELSRKKHGLGDRKPTLNTRLFRVPVRSGDQIGLF